MFRKCVLAVTLILAFTAQVFAHDFFIEKKDGAYYVVSGHENNCVLPASLHDSVQP